jgi:F-type H+-transporting ATPase subunit b
MSQTSTTAPAEGTSEATATETGQTEGTAAEGGAHGGGHFPPLDSKTFPSQIFWLVIFFALLYALMSKLVLPKLSKILEARASRIESDLAQAQKLKDETETAVKSYEKALSDARSKAAAIAQDNRDALGKEVEAERTALEATLSDKLQKAEAKIAASRNKAMANVSDVAAEAAAEIVAQLTGTKVTKAQVAKAISDAAKG